MKYIIDYGLSFYKDYPYNGKTNKCKIKKNEGRFLQEVDYNNFNFNIQTTPVKKTDFLSYNYLEQPKQNKSSTQNFSTYNFLEPEKDGFSNYNILVPKQNEILLTPEVTTLNNNFIPENSILLNNPTLPVRLEKKEQVNFTNDFSKYNSLGKKEQNPFVNESIYYQPLPKNVNKQQIITNPNTTYLRPEVKTVYINEKPSKKNNKDFLYNENNYARNIVEDPFQEFYQNKNQIYYNNIQPIKTNIINENKPTDSFVILDQLNNLSNTQIPKKKKKKKKLI